MSFHHRHRGSTLSLCLAVAGLCCRAQTARAIIVLGGDGTNPASTTPDNLELYEGVFAGGLATPISPTYMVTATHLTGAGVGMTNSFSYVGTPYSVVQVATNQDLAIWEISPGSGATFPTYAPLYTGGNEVGLPLITIGGGTVRGDTVPGGWAWDESQTEESWGSNTVDSIQTVTGQPGINGDYLYFTFDRQMSGNTLLDPNEGIYSDHDSGGGTFVLDPATGTYELAGINSLVDSVSSTADGMTNEPAALYDIRGYYSEYDPSDPSAPIVQYSGDTPIPEGSYAVRLDSSLGLLGEYVSVPEPAAGGVMVLVGSAALLRRGRRERWQARTF